MKYSRAEAELLATPSVPAVAPHRLPSSRELPELYAHVLDSMTEGVSIATEDGIIVYSNPAEDRMFGYAPGELIGQHVSVQNAYNPGDNLRRVEEVIEQLRKDGSWTGEWHNKRKDGSVFQTLARITTVTLQEATFFVCVQEDITVRKQAEEELRHRTGVAEEATQRLAAIVDSSDDAIISKDLNGIIRSWNKAAEQIFGYTADEIIGKPVATLAVPERVEEIPNIIECISRGERVDHYETKRQTKDGRVLDVSLTVSPIRNAAGEIIGASKVARDITEHKRRFEVQERLAAIVESSDDAIISKDLNGIIQSWNKGAERIFGYTAEEIIGRPVATLAVPERVEEIPNIIERIRRGERVDHYITKRQTKDGRVLTISLTVSPIKDSSGTIVGASKVARDITERERAQQLLHATNHALRRANGDLEQFAYAAAHDLKEPLRMVSIYSQLVQKNFGAVLGAEGQQYVRYAIEGARRMDALINDLLEYLHSSKFGEEAATPIDANAALERALASLSVRVEESGASIVAEGLPRVRMHEVHLQQLFQNLVGNALKYRGDATPDILIGSEQGNGEPVIFIRDNGIGIRSEYKEQIFELFRRLHTNDQYSGSGIGLAICKRIVEHYGGRMWVESELGRGSTFFFTVPT